MAEWQDAIVAEWTERQRSTPARPGFPLIEQNFDADEILTMTEVILSGQLTMATRVREFEAAFAAFVGAPHAVMVNSGSSANLLALAVASNPARPKSLADGDEVLVPAVCWSTSVWPLIQMRLKPVFVDVDPHTMNIDVADLRRKVTPRTRALLAVHILGNCGPMDEVARVVSDHGLMMIEDTCESLGSTWRGRALGTLGDFGTYSFYFSHHMTTGEGGMVVCRTTEDYDLLKCLRAHGWTRELSDRAALERKYDHIDSRFLFVNAGYNLRPMEIQGALGLKQLAKLEGMNRARVDNSARLIAALRAHPRWQDQFEFPRSPEGATPVWFGFPALLSPSVAVPLPEFLKRLSAAGIENRPIVSGNFARQPGLELFGHGVDWRKLTGAETVHQRGFFIGVHATALADDRIRALADGLLGVFA